MTDQTLGHIKILVIDDDPNLRKLCSLVLRDLGSVDEAADAAEGIAKTASAFGEHAPYHVIILDLHLPDMLGLQVLEILRNIEQHFCQGENRWSRILIMTSQDCAGTALSAIRKSADEYLVKPVRPRQMIDTVRNHALAVQRYHPGPRKMGRQPFMGFNLV